MVLRKTSLLVFFLVCIGFASCKKGNGSGKGKDLVLSTSELQEVTVDNAFTLRLFKNLDSANAGNANLFMSPLSIGFAFGMTANGAGGQTLAAINNTMGFNGFTQSQVNSYYNKLITNLPSLDPNTTLKIANSIWYSQSFSVLPQFIQTNSTQYNAKVQALDFSNASSLSTINNWVSAQTNGEIPSIVDQINPSDKMYLVNAIYFKSGWNEKFDPSKTNPLPFYLPNNTTVQASFMDSKIDYKRFDTNEAHVFEIPYSNKKYSMVIVMPETGTSVQQLAAGIDSTKWNSWMTGLFDSNSELKMPKFKFSYGINLNSTLINMGMGLAFSDQADFSGINATTPLTITRVEHKAIVDVDEDGTTAAAATSVSVGLTAVAATPPTVIDHPFIFAIRQISSGLILFVGTVNNPTTP